jgi:serine/threonine-protein kinase
VHPDLKSAAGVREGDVLAGKYRVERVLGVGGMGVVVAAHHLQLDEKVALKFLLPEAIGNAEAVARFAREARAAVRIKSEHVATIKDVGTLPNGAPYMVMEFLEGGDLSGWIRERGALPIEQAVEFVLQACVAVADAHALGIVHRDLKPANLFCVRRSDGQLSIKVLDFGISKLTEAAAGPGMAMTKTSALMGSPLYMSPEQMRSSKDVDAQTDIWALGVILFELIAGRPAFVAETVPELAIKIVTEPAPAIRTLRPDVPGQLEAVLFKCLEKDRRQRYRNVGELALALLPFAPKRAKGSVERISGIIQSAGLSASALAIPASPTADATKASAGTLPPLGRTTVGSSGGRKKSAIGASVLGGVALIGVVGSVALLRRAPANGDGSQAAAAQTASPSLSAPAVDPPKPPIIAAPPSATSLPPAPSEQVVTPPEPTTRVAPTKTSPRAVAHMPPAPAQASVTNPVATPVQPPPVPAPKLDCDPPYVIDAAGHRQYKPECLK